MNLPFLNISCRNETRRSPEPGTPIYYMGLYWFPIIFIFGTFGNALNLVVLNSKGMRTKTNFFLAAMAATDLCFFFVMGLLNLSVYEDLATSDTFLQWYFEAKMTLTVLANWLSTASIWIAIAVTVERLVAIRRPLHARLFWNSRRLALILISIFAASFYLVLYNWFWMWPITLPRCKGGLVYGLQMLTRNDSSILYEYVWASQYLAIFFSVVVPVVVLIFLNMWLVYSLRLNRREMTAQLTNSDDVSTTPSKSKLSRKMTTTAGGPASTSSASSPILRQQKTSESKVAFMVFVISASFVIFELPSAVLYSWETLAFFFLRHNRPTWFPLAAYFSNQLVTINKAVNFVVYCGAGQHFRHKLLKLLCKHFPFKRYVYGSRQNSRFYFSSSRIDHNTGTSAGVNLDSSARPSPAKVRMSRGGAVSLSQFYSPSKKRHVTLANSGATAI